MNNLFCPVIIKAEIVLQKSHDLARSYRKLRRSLRKCADCDFGDGCPAMIQNSSAIDTALNAIIEEWGIGLDG